MAWIWLNDKIYSGYQRNFPNESAIPQAEREKFPYCAAEFTKKYEFNKKIEKAVLSVSGDNFFHLFVNGRFEGMGPVLPGGDFLCKRPAPKHYENTYEISINGFSAEFFARVRLLPHKVCDYSRGHGGFMLKARLIFEDGSEKTVETDETWQGRRNTAYTGFCSFDSTVREDAFSFSQVIRDRWHAQRAPIEMLCFEDVCRREFTVSRGEKGSFTVELPKIYGAYPIFVSDGKCRMTALTSELEGQVTEKETAVFGGAGEYFSFHMHSVGFVRLEIENTDDRDVNVCFILRASFYPVHKTGSFVCDDEDFNKVYDVCMHTLKICRQTIHLDSTKHQELLACTGDYYIDSLMTVYMFGDMKLSEFDLLRTADWIVLNNGRMFHTTYSLIWVQMLRDVYMVTGSMELLKSCEKALDRLLERFETYMDDTGVIAYPPDFMFVDWTVVDGYSMHHPPKALGQTVLNCFYYQALKNGGEIYGYLGEENKARECAAKAERFFTDFNREFFDGEKQLYFDGKNDAYGGYAHYAVYNSEKRYFTKYPNILACLYGLCEGEKAVSVLERIIFNEDMQDIQPYFMHYMIGAVRKAGLFGKYGMKLLERWKDVVRECDKGLKEGWIAPEEGYSFDHSHAWGGTVGYQLPSVISGMEIKEPGMKKLIFRPELYTLNRADIKIPTVYGDIVLNLKKGEKPVISAPGEIEITIL